MEMVPVHLPETMVEDLDRVAKRGGLDRSTPVRRLPRAGLERHVDEPCGRGELSRREAAAWMGVDVREAMGRLADLGVTGNITLEEAQAALDLNGGLPDDRPTR